jgi:hypothetical protein
MVECGVDVSPFGNSLKGIKRERMAQQDSAQRPQEIFDRPSQRSVQRVVGIADT